MSKAVKGIKKVTKKIGKVVKKIAPYALMAVAAYFTAGVALSYFGPTASFAASLPGFGSAGVFTKAATAIGLSGPANAAAAVASTTAGVAGTSTAAATSTAAGSAASSAIASGVTQAAGQVAGQTAGQVAGQTAGQVVGQTAGQVVGEVGKQVGGETVKKSAMSVADKVLLAKVVTDTASGLFAKEPYDPTKYFFGYNRKGEGMDIISGDFIGQGLGVNFQMTPQQHYDRAQARLNPPSVDARNTAAGRTKVGQTGVGQTGGDQQNDDEDGGFI